MYSLVTAVLEMVVWFVSNVWSLNNWIEKAQNTGKSLKNEVCAIHPMPFFELGLSIIIAFYVVHKSAVTSVVVLLAICFIFFILNK